MILRTIQSLDLLKGQHALSGFVEEKFPELWQEALGMQ